MKSTWLHIIFGIVVAGFAFASPEISEAKTVRVKGGVSKRGVYRQAHNRTSPDRSRYNNYGSKGNVNPYTGKKGTKRTY